MGGRGSGSRMSSGGGNSEATSGNGLSRQQMDEMGITRIENGKEVIVKDGVKYTQINGWGYGNDFARTDGYGMSGNGEKPTLNSILGGRDTDEVSYSMIDTTNYGSSKAGAREKYAQLTRVANGDISGTDYTAADFIRRGTNPGPEYMSYNRNGKPTGWRSDRLSDRHVTYSNGSKSFGGNYANGMTQLQRDLGSRAKTSIEKSMQKSAAQWLKDNPDRSGQKGWRFNGKKWVETGRR